MRARDKRQLAQRLHLRFLHDPLSGGKAIPHFIPPRSDIPFAGLQNPFGCGSVGRENRGLQALRPDVALGQYVALQLAAFVWEDDPEAVGRHHGSQAIGERTKQYVAIQVVANGTVHVEKCCGLEIEAVEIRVSFAQLFIGMLALQLGTAAIREYFQRRDVLFGGLHRLPVQHRQMPQRPALSVP